MSDADCTPGREPRSVAASPLSSFFFSSPNLSGRRLDVYQTSAPGVALLWSPYGIGQTIIFLPCGYLSFFVFSSPYLSRRRLDVCHTSTHANLRCRSETCCTRLAANTGRKKVSLSGYIFATEVYISTIVKNVLSTNTSSTRSHNMVNLGPLTAEIGSGVWGTPANFNWFRVLAALLHGICSGRQPNVAALNGRRHLSSAGLPSRWALAHILVKNMYFIGYTNRTCIKYYARRSPS